jgi:hypothetical protein
MIFLNNGKVFRFPSQIHSDSKLIQFQENPKSQDWKRKKTENYHFRSSSPEKPQTPISRIPIRTANAEKRARELGLVPDIDETQLSPSELRALRWVFDLKGWKLGGLKSVLGVWG